MLGPGELWVARDSRRAVQVLGHRSQRVSDAALHTWGNGGPERGRDLPTAVLGQEQSRAGTQVPTCQRQGGGPTGRDQRPRVVAWKTGASILRTCLQSPHLFVPPPPPGALEIGQALPVHTGRYTCTAQNSAGVARKHVVLTVQGRVPGPSAQTAVALGEGSR